MPCYLFRSCPQSLLEEEDDAGDASSDMGDVDDEECAATKQTLLKDDQGYYVRSAEDVDVHLDVRKYSQAWPMIPSEELHASSIQHPAHPAYRWLLNTRRVPILDADSRPASEQSAVEPPCAGVADPDKALWICFRCAQALCRRRKPMRPFFALSNWNWGGRVHPLYRNLSIATETLLGLAILVCRLIVLRYTDRPDEQEKGFVGNTILLAQPKPEEIMQSLPPSDADVSKYMSVCFNATEVTQSKLKSQKARTVDPVEYVQCARLRQQVCPVFADVTIDEERVREQWPEPSVPRGITEGAQAMDTLHTFKPNLDGPASMRAASCQLPDAHENDFNAVEDDDEEINMELREPSSDCPVCEETGLPLDLPAEFLIGVQESDSQDPVDRMIAFQKRMGLVHDLADKMHAAAQTRALMTSRCDDEEVH